MKEESNVKAEDKQHDHHKEPEHTEIKPDHQ